MNIINNPDKHFMELFGDLLTSMENSPINQIIAGDYGKLLEYDIISNLHVTDKVIEFDLGLDILEMGFDSIHLAINSMVDEEGNYSLDGISISGFDIGDGVISLNARVRDYNEDKSTINRLDPNAEYMNFSNIKVLLELGINTSIFEYFHIKGTAQLKTLAGLVDFDIPVDIRIRNNNGNVELEADLTEIPTIAGVNKALLFSPVTSRDASIYYNGDNIYIYRHDGAKQAANVKNYSRRCSIDYFTDNIVNLLCSDILGLEKSIMDQITKSMDRKEDVQISYEDIVKQFVYTPGTESDHFKFAISLYALTKDDMLKKDLVLDVYSNNKKMILERIKVALTLSVGISLDISADLKLQDDCSEELNESNRLNALEAFISAHSNDALNEIVSFK